MEIAKLDVQIGTDIKPLVAGLDQAKQQLINFANLEKSLGDLKPFSPFIVQGIQAAKTVQQLTDALAQLKIEQAAASNPAELVAYNNAIKAVTLEVKRLQTQTQVLPLNQEFDKASASVNSFGKGLTGAFTQVRQLAYILPGIGIAGLFNLAFEAISAAVKELNLFNSQLKDVHDGTITAIEDYSKEANQVAILVNQLQNENLSRQDKVKAINELQKLSPNYFSNLKLEGDQIVNLTGDYAKYGQAIILVAKIKAASDLNQKNVTAQIEEELHTSERLLLLEQKKAYAEKGGVNVQQQRLLILEDQLEAQTKLAQQSKPLVDIITQAEIELEALGGNPLDGPVKGTTTINKNLKETVQLVKEIKTAFPETIVGVPLLPQTRNLDKIPALFGQIKQDTKSVNDVISEMISKMGFLHDAVNAISTAFADMFAELITTGKVSIKTLERAIASLVQELVKAVIETALLRIITAALGGGAFNPGLLTQFLSSNAIPHLAGGGVVSGPTTALIGESGPEAVIPLDRLQQMIGGLGGSNISISGELRAHGTDLVVALNRGNVRINRNYGQNFTN